MTPREIRRWPDPILSQPCDEVEIHHALDGTLRQLVLDLRETVRIQFFPAARGLSAPQVGEPLRVFVLDDGHGLWRAFVNPTVTWTAEETSVISEGCLSIPGAVAEIERPVAVAIEALDDRMEPFNVRLTGENARVALHEIDHLDGITIMDRADEREEAVA